jgi:hypothetical protein
MYQHHQMCGRPFQRRKAGTGKNTQCHDGDFR